MGSKFESGRLAGVEVVRLLPGTDVIEGLEAVCRQCNIKGAVITCCIGSLQKAAFFIAVPMDNDLGAGYSQPIVLEGPLEFLSGQGTVGMEEDGRIFVHLHGLFSDQDGRVHGGHLIKGRNPVLITLEVLISRLAGIRLLREHDPKVGMKLLSPLAAE